MKFFIIQFSPPTCSCLLPGLQHIPQHPFSNALILCSSLNYSARGHLKYISRTDKAQGVRCLSQECQHLQSKWELYLRFVRRQLQKISSVHFGTVLPSILVTTLYIYPLKDQNATFNVMLSLDSSEHCTFAMQCSSSSNDHTALCITKNGHQRIKKFPKFTCIQIPMLYCQGRKCAPCGSMRAVEEGGTGSQQFT